MVLQEMYVFGTSMLQHICDGGGLMSYMAMYMDTIPKLLNHLLFGLGICNICLFFVSFNSGTGADAMSNSMHSFLLSVLLCCQTSCVWRMLNGNPQRSNSGSGINSAMATAVDHMFTPSEFLVGVALGITIGGAIVSFILSRFYGQLSLQCDKELAWITKQQQQQHSTTIVTNNSTAPTAAPPSAASVDIHSILQHCGDYKGAILGIWFWSGMVFWFNLAIAILIAMGRQELTNQFYQHLGQQYETIDPDDNNNPHIANGGGAPQLFPQYQQQQQQRQANASSGFAGNYPSIPEVRPQASSANSSSWDASTASDPLSSHQHSRPAA